MDKENTKGRIGRSTEKKEKNSKPVATVKPRGKSLPRSAPVPVAVPSTKKFTATVPVTPNVLKKRRAVRMTKVQPEQFVFKAKPAPAFHKSTGSLQQVTAKISKMQIGTGTSTATKREEKEKAKTTLKPTTAAPPFTARAPRREQRSTGPARVRVRSKSVPSVPHHQATIPVTPMVLKRNFRRTNPGHGQERQEVGFKAKPAEVLHRQPFKPKLPCNSQNNQNQSTCSTQSTTKAFDLCLEDRLKDRKLFNHRATDALEKRQKQVRKKFNFV